MGSKFGTVNHESVKRGDIVVSRDDGRRGNKYGVYVGDGHVIEYQRGIDGLGKITSNALESFRRRGEIRVSGMRIFRYEHPDRVDRANKLYNHPTHEWDKYNYRYRNSQTFVQFCATGMLNGKNNSLRRRMVRGFATKVNKYIYL